MGVDGDEDDGEETGYRRAGRRARTAARRRRLEEAKEEALALQRGEGSSSGRMLSTAIKATESDDVWPLVAPYFVPVAAGAVERAFTEILQHRGWEAGNTDQLLARVEAAGRRANPKWNVGTILESSSSAADRAPLASVAPERKLLLAGASAHS